MGNGGEGRGTLILILGILGLVCCMPCGIVAWVMGSADMKRIAAGQIPESERALTQVGMILGIVAVVLAVISLVIWVLWMVLFGAAMAGAAGGM